MALTVRHRKAPWVAVAVAALWLVAALMLTGCSTRMEPTVRHALSVTAIEGARDVRELRGQDLRDGYSRSLAVLCVLIERDAKAGRGWIEWLVGAAGLDSGPSGEFTAAEKEACHG